MCLGELSSLDRALLAGAGLKDGEGHGRLLRLIQASLEIARPSVVVITQALCDLACRHPAVTRLDLRVACVPPCLKRLGSRLGRSFIGLCSIDGLLRITRIIFSRAHGRDVRV
jgi:hypothetical protein